MGICASDTGYGHGGGTVTVYQGGYQKSGYATNRPVANVPPNIQTQHQQQQLAQQQQQAYQQQQYQKQLQQQSQMQAYQQQQVQSQPQPETKPIQAVKPQAQFRFSAVADVKLPPNVVQAEITKEMLERYVELEKQAHEYESKYVIKSLKVKKEQQKDIEKNIKLYEKEYSERVEETKKEKDDVDKMQEPSVKEFFKDQTSFDAQMSKEQEEYLDALNRQEVMKKELDGAKKQLELVASEIEKLEQDAQELYAIYREEDDLLAKIFGGKYGSDLEYKLETELDMAMDRKQRIGVAKFKWQNGRVLLNHACNQLAFATRRWQDLNKCQPSQNQLKYQIATETRNNIIAACQNITSAQRYLNTIQFPYCNPGEVATLEKASQHIYTDMQTIQRQNHALQCYSTTHRRCAALIQWFDYVVSGTIVKDLDSASKEVNAKERQLREERLRLIKNIVSEQLDEDVDMIFSSEPHEFDEEEETDLDEEVAMMMEADAVSTLGDGQAVITEEGKAEGLSPGGEVMKAPTPMPLNELAPPPDTSDLFGNIDELKKQHEQEIEEFNRAQELNKARMDQGLQEKLMARRSRRARQQAQTPAN